MKSFWTSIRSIIQAQIHHGFFWKQKLFSFAYCFSYTIFADQSAGFYKSRDQMMTAENGLYAYSEFKGSIRYSSGQYLSYCLTQFLLSCGLVEMEPWNCSGFTLTLTLSLSLNLNKIKHSLFCHPVLQCYIDSGVWTAATDNRNRRFLNFDWNC